MILYCQVVNRCFVWGAWGGVGDWGKTGNKMENCWGLDDLSIGDYKYPVKLSLILFW